MKTKIKNRIDYFLLIVLYVPIHIALHTNYWDDLTMKNLVRANDFNIIENVINIWNNWTSRIVTEIVMDVVIMMPDFIWRILNVLAVVFLYHNVIKILEYVYNRELEVKDKLIHLFIFASVPFSLFATAGWMVTSICYLWIISAFSYAVRVLLYSINGKINNFEICMYCCALVFFGSYDITGVISLGILLVILFIYRDKSSRSFYNMSMVGILISVANIIAFVVCPGNRSRMQLDAQYHGTADLLELNFVEKIRMGINSTFYHFVSIPNMIFFLLVFLVAIIVICDKEFSIVNKILGIIPLINDVFWSLYMFIKYTIKNRSLTYLYPDGSFKEYPKKEQYAVMITSIICILIITYFLFKIIKNINLALIVTAVLYLFGIMPQVALGFTTAVTSSCIRMSLYLYYAFLILIMIMYNEKVNDSYMPKIKNTILSLAILGTLLNLLQVTRHIMVYG